MYANATLNLNGKLYNYRTPYVRWRLNSSGSLAIFAAIRRASMAKIGRAATVMSNRVSVSLPTAAAQCFGRRLALCRSWRNYRRCLCP